MVLETPRLRLREFLADDLAALRRVEGSPEVLRHMTYARRTESDYEDFLFGCRHHALEVPRVTWELAVVPSGEATPIGRCGLKLEDERRQAMVWYLLDPARWGSGYATEAVTGLLSFAFEALGVHRVYADIDPRNPASARVCERAGMRREAHFVENVEIRGEWCDTWIYAVLRREWRASSSAGRGARGAAGTG